ncbi:hypothetical protein FH972_026555 [Carpinus fangiana]|uniref:Uncharacterized protein n=1 Tax=Carpinus fangiana TaxID=176857 RepID=A0A5N6L4B9_9ROSI|nr:hypothetical protein FH972_026555 [Carpinus fangiana]
MSSHRQSPRKVPQIAWQCRDAFHHPRFAAFSPLTNTPCGYGNTKNSVQTLFRCCHSIIRQNVGRKDHGEARGSSQVCGHGMPRRAGLTDSVLTVSKSDEMQNEAIEVCACLYDLHRLKAVANVTCQATEAMEKYTIERVCGRTIISRLSI